MAARRLSSQKRKMFFVQELEGLTSRVLTYTGRGKGTKSGSSMISNGKACHGFSTSEILQSSPVFSLDSVHEIRHPWRKQKLVGSVL